MDENSFIIYVDSKTHDRKIFTIFSLYCKLKSLKQNKKSFTTFQRRQSMKC